MKFIAVGFFLLSGLLMLIGCHSSQLEVNDLLPNFKFYNSEGNPVYIYQYLYPGKLLLIHFWGASCCSSYSVPTMKAVSEIHKSKTFDHVTVVSVNLDYPKIKIQRIIKELIITHPLMNDPDDAFYKKEPKLKNVFPLAFFLVVDDKGIIKKKMMGPQLAPAINELLNIKL